MRRNDSFLGLGQLTMWENTALNWKKPHIDNTVLPSLRMLPYSSSSLQIFALILLYIPLFDFMYGGRINV